MEVPSITATELAAELKGEKPPVMLDVRESDELAVSHIPGVLHIPVGELEGRVNELSVDNDLVVICRSGGRSGRATAFLLQAGFPTVRNLVGGMQGWARDVDPSLTVA